MRDPYEKVFYLAAAFLALLALLNLTPSRPSFGESSEVLPPRGAGLEKFPLRKEPASRPESYVSSEEPSSSHYPTPLLAVQLLNLEGDSPEELRQTFRDLRRLGANTIILRVFKNKDDSPLLSSSSPSGPEAGVYFKTEEAPFLGDILGLALDAARSEGLRLFAWMSTLYADWVLEKNPDMAGYRFSLRRRHLERNERLDPFHPGVRQYLRGVFRDLARYPLDGILIQDDLILRHTEGYGPHADRLYRNTFGAAIEPEAMYQGIHPDSEGIFRVARYTDKFWRWTLWRNRELFFLAEDLMGTFRALNPKAKICLNVFYEAVLDPRNALAWMAFDLKRASGLPVDYFALMAYHRQISRELAIPLEESLGLLRQMASSGALGVRGRERILLKVQTLDWATGEEVPPEELERAVRAALSGGALNLALVARLVCPLSPALVRGLQVARSYLKNEK